MIHHIADRVNNDGAFSIEAVISRLVTVVKHFHVVKQTRPCFAPRFVIALHYQISFER